MARTGAAFTTAMALPATTERVEIHTRPQDLERIRRDLEFRVAYYADHPEEIADRLRELDREWDVERTLEANAASLVLAGTVLGLLSGRRFLVVPAIVGGFLLQHALQGWCPPVPLLRRMGRRTQAEIEAERYALKALRGDFDGLREVPSEQRASRALAAAGR